MVYHLSEIPNIDPNDHCVAASGILRLDGPEPTAEGLSYTSTIRTRKNRNLLTIPVIVQTSGTALQTPSVILLSSAYLAFGKAGRPFSIYTIPARSKPLNITKTEGDRDHEDLGRLWCDLSGTIRHVRVFKHTEDRVSVTWILHVPLDGGFFEAYVKHGSSQSRDLQTTMKTFSLGQSASFRAQWVGMDRSDPVVPVFLIDPDCAAPPIE